MIVAISGSSGLIGTALARTFEQRGDEVRRLVRRAAKTPKEIAWDPARGTIDSSRLEGVDVVINLSGEDLAQRWSQGVKRRIRESRVETTSLLARTIASLSARPRAFLSASAIGIYGNRGDEVLDETSKLGDDFLADVCKEWEAATQQATACGVRVVSLRSGLVLSRRGGLLGKLLFPFRMGLGGPIGSGKQWMSWIDIGDYTSAVVYLIEHPSIEGPVNLVSPHPVRNADFAQTLARVLVRPALLSVPEIAIKLMFGEMGEGTILASQRVRPGKLLKSDFEFRQPALAGALRARLLGG